MFVEAPPDPHDPHDPHDPQHAAVEETGSASETDDDTVTANELVARQLYSEGVERFEKGNFAGALERFEQAYAYAPLPALQYNIAHCLEELGRRPASCSAYRKLERMDSSYLREAAKTALARLGC